MNLRLWTVSWTSIWPKSMRIQLTSFWMWTTLCPSTQIPPSTNSRFSTETQRSRVWSRKKSRPIRSSRRPRRKEDKRPWGTTTPRARTSSILRSGTFLPKQISKSKCQCCRKCRFPWALSTNWLCPGAFRLVTWTKWTGKQMFLNTWSKKECRVGKPISHGTSKYLWKQLAKWFSSTLLLIRLNWWSRMTKELKVSSWWKKVRFQIKISLSFTQLRISSCPVTLWEKLISARQWCYLSSQNSARLMSMMLIKLTLPRNKSKQMFPIPEVNTFSCWTEVDLWVGREYKRQNKLWFFSLRVCHKIVISTLSVSDLILEKCLMIVKSTPLKLWKKQLKI